MVLSHGRVHVHCLVGLAVLACGLLGSEALSRSGQQKGPVDEQTIQALIKQLGDDSYDTREAAEKRLIEIGGAAGDLLRKAAKENPDAEIRFRAARVLQDVGSDSCVLELKFEETKAPQGKKLLTRVALSPDFGTVYATGAGQPHAWDIKTGKEVLSFDARPGAPCWSLAISPDGKLLLSGCSGGSAHMYDAKTGKKVRVLAGIDGGAWGVVLLADGKRAITAGGAGAIHTWEIQKGNDLGAFAGVHDNIRCMAISPDAKMLATGHFTKEKGTPTVRLWDIDKAVELRSMNGHKFYITWVAFSPDSKTLLSTSNDKTVRLWDVGSGAEQKTLTGHGGPVEAAAFTPDGSRIVSCGSGADPSLRLWSVETGKQIAEGPRSDIGFTGVAILPDGKRCLTVDGEGPVRLWRWVK